MDPAFAGPVLKRCAPESIENFVYGSGLYALSPEPREHNPHWLQYLRLSTVAPRSASSNGVLTRPYALMRTKNNAIDMAEGHQTVESRKYWSFFQVLRASEQDAAGLSHRFAPQRLRDLLKCEGYSSSSAYSMSFSHSWGNSMPATRAASGTSEVLVMPGRVLVSRIQHWPSASSIKSLREMPRQPRME